MALPSTSGILVTMPASQWDSRPLHRSQQKAYLETVRAMR
jgi:hypothetical protein